MSATCTMNVGLSPTKNTEKMSKRSSKKQLTQKITCSSCKETYQLSINKIEIKSFRKLKCCHIFVCSTCVRDPERILKIEHRNTEKCPKGIKELHFERMDDADKSDLEWLWSKLKAMRISIPKPNAYNATCTQVSDDYDPRLTMSESGESLPGILQSYTRKKLEETLAQMSIINMVDHFQKGIDFLPVKFVWLYYKYDGNVQLQNSSKTFQEYKEKMREQLQKKVQELGKVREFDIISGSLCIRFAIELKNDGTIERPDRKLYDIVSTELETIPHPATAGEILTQTRISVDRENLIIDLTYDYEEALDDAVKEYFRQQMEKPFRFHGDYMAKNIRIVSREGEEVLVRVADYETNLFNPGSSVEVTSSNGQRHTGTVVSTSSGEGADGAAALPAKR